LSEKLDFRLERVVFDNFAKDAHEFGIMFFPGLDAQSIHDLRVALCMMVWPCHGHRVVAVGDGDDTGADRNFISRTSIRIALAIVVLVMMTNCEGGLQRAFDLPPLVVVFDCGYSIIEEDFLGLGIETMNRQAPPGRLY
jgi:hypothetical protein